MLGNQPREAQAGCDAASWCLMLLVEIDVMVNVGVGCCRIWL